jgi:hypothetical protein
MANIKQRYKRRVDLRQGLDAQLTEVHKLADSLDLIQSILDLGAAAGSSTSTDPFTLYGVSGDVKGASLTKTANYIAGVMGKYSVTGVKSTTYPAGAVLAEIGDGVSEADGAVVAFIGGDTAITKAGAAFKVRTTSSIAASGFDFGVDLQDAIHDGYQAVNSSFYKKGIMRLTEDVLVLVGTATPTDGVSGTGAGNAGPGSLHLNTSDGKLRTNTNTKASPTWTVVGAQVA